MAKVVTVTQYEAQDGSLFLTEHECDAHDFKLENGAKIDVMAEAFLNTELTWDALQQPLLGHKVNTFKALYNRIEMKQVEALVEASTEEVKAAAAPVTGPLADRFGLSIGFHNCSQDDYLAIIAGYAAHHGLSFDPADALEWAKRRGQRSGRVAWHYVTELAGREGRSL